MIFPRKSISIRQPWAHHILHSGKDVENRTWKTNFRGPVLIHASLKIERLPGNLHVSHPPVGGIVGMVEIVDCVQNMDSEWFFGPWGFVLKNPQPLEFVPCKGALSFFTPKIDVADLRLMAARP